MRMQSGNTESGKPYGANNPVFQQISLQGEKEKEQ